MNARGIVTVGLLACLALAGCGEGTDEASYGKPFLLPVGDSEWDQVPAPAWLRDGTLHVGEQTVELADADQFVLGRTGVYWMRDNVLMFTDVDGATQEVEEVRWGNVAFSADRSVFATVDQSRGPEDRYGTHVIQVAAFDTTTGEQLYRTPDEEPDKGADLADLYSEIMPLLYGVSDERLFFAGETIDLADGSTTPATQDPEGMEVYPGLVETVFPDGYRVGIRVKDGRAEPAESELFGVGRLSPDRSTLFDASMWPARAVAYDAETGERREIDAPWRHFTLAGFIGEDTFYGTAEEIDPKAVDSVLRAMQVVTCEVATLRCTPVSPVIPYELPQADEPSPSFLMEGRSGLL